MKRKPKLRWVATRLELDQSYTVEKSLSGIWLVFMWSRRDPYPGRFKTKRAAIAACERHAAERRGK